MQALVFAALSAAALAQQPQLPVPEEDRVAPTRGRQVAGFEIQVGCSETELRTPIATLTWKPRPGREAAGALRVDVAAGKQGFEKGQFVKLFLGPAPRVEPTAGLQRETQGTLGRTLALEVDAAGREEVGGQSRLRVRNMEPGVLYFWRMAERTGREWAGGRTVRVEAPVCVADLVEEKR